jgi:uncharacterized protein YqeY
MALRERLDAELKAAMLAKDAAKLSALRMIKSTVRNKEIDLKKTLEDADMVSVCSTIKKQWEETLAQAKTGGREDVIAQSMAELAVVQSFLPEALSEAAINDLIAQAITTTGATSQKDMGKVMKVVSEQTKGRADGKIVSDLVKAKLATLG